MKIINMNNLTGNTQTFRAAKFTFRKAEGLPKEVKRNKKPVRVRLIFLKRCRENLSFRSLTVR